MNDNRIAEQAHRRHALQRFGPVEAIALGVVGPAALDRSGEARDQRRVHLAIAIDLDHDVHALVECRLIAGAHGAAYALVLFVEDHPHARVVALLAHQFATAIGALVVNHVDALYLRRHACNHVEYVVTPDLFVFSQAQAAPVTC